MCVCQYSTVYGCCIVQIAEDSFRLQLFSDDNEQDRPSKKNK